jgi:hypothetical protein
VLQLDGCFQRRTDSTVISSTLDVAQAEELRNSDAQLKLFSYITGTSSDGLTVRSLHEVRNEGAVSAGSTAHFISETTRAQHTEHTRPQTLPCHAEEHKMPVVSYLTQRTNTSHGK